jgi:hypothetical protein
MEPPVSKEQNVIDMLMEGQQARMTRLNALQRDAQRLAFESVVEGSWKAQGGFRDVSEAIDRLSDEIALTALALVEARPRLEQRGRDCHVVMAELMGGKSDD